MFTHRPFSGNPLAVAVDPGPLATDQLQAVAAELNLSETAFAWPAGEGGRRWRVRIFTPAIELPFAGHPSLGTAFLLAHLGLAPAGGRRAVRVVLDEDAGPVAVRVGLGGAGRPRRATLTAAHPPVDVAAVEPSAAARVVGLPPSALHLSPALAPRALSAGLGFTVVAVRDVAALAAARLDRAAWSEVVADTPAPHVYVVAPAGGGPPGRRWRARMFAPAMGIAEDPATGAAAAAFAGLAAAATGLDRWDVDQGVEVGRPSRLAVRARRGPGGTLEAVEVGGACVVVGGGELAVPPGRPGRSGRR